MISTYAKLLRANEHLQTLDSDMDKVVAKLNPYPLAVELNEKTGWCELWAEPVSFGPETTHLPMVVGDIVHNFRSALDHLAWDLARVAKKKPGRKSQFPICCDGVDFICSARTMLKGVLPEHVAAIEEAQPYYGGKPLDESPLRWLSVLSNIDKHRHFVITAATLDRVELEFPSGEPEGLKTWPGILDGRTKIGRYRCPDGKPAVDMKGYVTLSVVFGDRGLIRGRQITETLHIIGIEIGHIVKRFLTEFKIGEDSFA